MTILDLLVAPAVVYGSILLFLGALYVGASASIRREQRERGKETR